MKTRRILRKGLRVALLGSAVMALTAPAANAGMNWNEPSFDFDSRQVGTTSEPKTLALVATCDAPLGPFPINTICGTPGGGVHQFGAVSTVGPFAVVPDTDTCTAQGGVLVTQTYPGVAACTLQVVFQPTSPGTKIGRLDTASGPDVTLRGTGLPAPAKAKKCKKKKGKKAGVAAKKCKKKKKK